MQPTQLLSVVISTYNRSDALLAVLDGLARQTDTNFEVIVADDGSGPPHLQRIIESSVAKKLHVVHFWHPDIGFTLSSVRNRAAGLTRGEYIVFMDGDCVPEIDFIAQHKRLAQRGHFLSGSRVLISAELTDSVVGGGLNLVGRSVGFWFKQRLLGHSNKLTGLLRLPDWRGRIRRSFTLKGIRGCNLAVWKSDFETVDGFDESFVGWGHEDADFVLRLHHAGVVRKNGFCATEVYHLWHKESSRADESSNANVVSQRVKTCVIRATLGYSRVRNSDDVVITRLG